MNSPKKRRRRGSFAWKKLDPVSRIKQKPIYKLNLPENVVTSDYSSCSCLSSSSEASALSGSMCSLECKSLCSDREGVSEIDSESEFTNCEVNTRRTRTLQHRNVTVIIPDDNLSSYCRDDFYLEFIEDPSFRPTADSRRVYVSQILSVGPHGARFYDDKPALIYLPITENIEQGDRVICLCSNTPKDIPPHWEEMPPENYKLKNGRIVIRANHFSLFTVVVERPFPEISRNIEARFGATLRVPDVQGVEVSFPPNALVKNVKAFVRVLYDWEPGHSVLNYNYNGGMLGLASPVIMVGPHGCSFNPGSNPVTVCLPIPNYTEIKQRFGQCSKITVWQSATRENEPLIWEPLEVDLEIKEQTGPNGSTYVVTFPVNHFSFFKALWDILSSSLYEVKLGAAFFYPFISFSMMCQAWMEENKDTQRFGLEVICYRSDNRLPEATNYKYKVGASLKPKLVRPGCIIVRLKSELFEADVEAGEDVNLTKLEPDFRGREFEKQFACRFKQNKPLVERGAIGKVVVERQGKGGNSNEPLFEFNLNKTGIETEPSPSEGTDRWSVVAITELAGTLRITEENNWKKFARHIGFTKNEINSKFMYSPDPFLAMVNLYQARGGTPEEFVQALYAVSRQINLQGGASGSGSPGSSTGGPSTSRKWPNFGFTPRRWRDDNSDTDSASAASASTSSRKRSNPNSGSSGGGKGGRNDLKAKRRRRFSDVSETMSSSEESSTVNELKNIPGDYKLNDNHMWRISEFMNTQNWRALGRTLGLEESILLNIEHAYKSTGFRECAYQMLLEWKGRQPALCTFKVLHTALSKENMNSVAKQLAGMKLADP